MKPRRHFGIRSAWLPRHAAVAYLCLVMRRSWVGVMRHANRTPKLAFLAFALIGTAACGVQQRADLETLRSKDAALTKAVAEKNLERILKFYADDASILPMEEPVASGKQAIRREWSHILGIPGFRNTGTATDVEVSRAGDLGYTRGTYATTFDLADGTTETEHGKWVSVWKKQADGSWKIAVEIYNTDAPPPIHQ